MAPLNTAQQAVLIGVSSFASVVSLCGSIVLIRMATIAQRRRATYNRLLIGLSLTDVVHSISWSLQPFLIPRDPTRLWSIGNTTTCSAEGFLSQFGSSVFLYNASLTVYFLLTIVVVGDDLRPLTEVCLHLLPVGYPLATATIGVVIGLYSPLQLGSVCWIGEYPRNCNDREDVGCISTMLAWVFSGIPAALSVLVLIVVNAFIYCKVRSTLNRTRRFSIAAKGVRRTSGNRPHRADLEVAVQSTLYVLACVLTLVFSMIVRTLESMGVTREQESSVFGLLVAMHLFYPLQGFWNFLIYVRPRYMKWRRREPYMSRWFCFQQALNRDNMLLGSTAFASQSRAHDFRSGEGISQSRTGFLNTLSRSLEHSRHRYPADRQLPQEQVRPQKQQQEQQQWPPVPPPPKRPLSKGGSSKRLSSKRPLSKRLSSKRALGKRKSSRRGLQWHRQRADDSRQSAQSGRSEGAAGDTDENSAAHADLDGNDYQYDHDYEEDLGGDDFRYGDGDVHRFGQRQRRDQIVNNLSIEADFDDSEPFSLADTHQTESVLGEPQDNSVSAFGQFG